MVADRYEWARWPFALAVCAPFAVWAPAPTAAQSVFKVDAATVPPPGWSTGEVEAEQARCAVLLRGLDIVAKPLPSLREHECGAAAPLELTSVGRSPRVTFYPSVTVTCELAAGLARWVKTEVQPLARKQFGSDIVRIDTMSSYSCRTAYGRKNARLSEHGKANAVDLRSFTTAKGLTSEVLADWGPTGRDIADQVAAARKADAVRTAAAVHARSSTVTGSVPTRPAASAATWAMPSLSIGPASASATGSVGHPAIGFGLPESSGTGFGFSTGFGGPSRLGGPKAADPTLSSPQVTVSKAQFLRGVHDAACHIFGTTLGPEANAAHRNHLHVDMAERKIKVICE